MPGDLFLPSLEMTFWTVATETVGGIGAALKG